MNRTGLIVALVIAVINGVTFALFPGLELAVAKPFSEIVDAAHNVFALRLYEPLAWVRDIGLWVSTVIIAPVVGAVVLKLLFPRRKLLVPGRAIVFLIATLALGPGLLVNVVLKEHWGRPRPIEVTQFGGPLNYVPWWDPRGACDSNCSFVSGDVSGAAWTLAPAALVPAPWRVAAYAGALVLTVGMAVIRVVQGGHFVSDAVFASVFTFLVIWLAYAMIYRWPRTRLSDEAIERGIERISIFRKRK